jgi:hypothetical protein
MQNIRDLLPECGASLRGSGSVETYSGANAQIRQIATDTLPLLRLMDSFQTSGLLPFLVVDSNDLFKGLRN